MKKLTLLFLFLCAGFTSMAQVEIGLMVSPTISGNRFVAEDKYNLKKESSNLNLGVGVIADYFFAQNYAFSTGLIYRGKGSEIKYNYSRDNGSGAVVTTQGKDDITLQYLEIPVTLKLFTNEIAPATVAFFQVGGSLNTKVAGKINDRKVIDGKKAMKRFSTFEADVQLGGGVEYQVGQSTKVFAGLTYHRGLSNIDDYYGKLLGDKNISIKNNSVSIDFGVKF